MSHPTPRMFSPEDTDSESESVARAETAGVVLRRIGTFTYLTRLTDAESDNPHDVRLATEQDKMIGTCDCLGFEHHDGPCAHLLAVCRAERHGVVSIDSVSSALGGTPECPTCDGGI